MTNEEKQNVLDVIDNEGFDYTFISYTDFNEIEDEKFHILRKQYIKIREEFADYIHYDEF